MGNVFEKAAPSFGPDPGNRCKDESGEEHPQKGGGDYVFAFWSQLLRRTTRQIASKRLVSKATDF